MLCWILTPVAVLAGIVIVAAILFSIIYLFGLFVLSTLVNSHDDDTLEVMFWGLLSILICILVCVVIIPLSFLMHPYICHLVGVIK
jgi:hypothetical protein